MAATVIPGQPRRWGNESTNFYYTSNTSAPGVPSRQKVYRCSDSQYTNSGHYHTGTKSINLNPPLDEYGTASAHKLRLVDQLVPKALTTAAVLSPLPADPTVNLYQSHRQNYHSYAMTSAPVLRSPAELVGGEEAVARALNRAFYTTSYQSHITKYASQRSRPSSANSQLGAPPTDLNATPSLCDNLDTRRNRARPARVQSAPPLRQPRLSVPHPPSTEPRPPTLSRRRSFTTHYPSKGEMLKSIFLVFPAPQPQGASKRASRPSSAVSLRSGKIPHLRN